MNNTEKSKTNNTATRAVLDAAMLLLRDAATFSAFQKIRETTTAEQRRPVQLVFCERKEFVYVNIVSEIKKKGICDCRVNENA
jgi:hypothetical protein